MRVSIEQAREIVLSMCSPTEPVMLDVNAATGCVLAADVTSVENVPPFANSAVDGYAVLADDLRTPPVELAVVDEVAAGAASTRMVRRGQAIRIMTGAPMPPGADAVVMVENTERLDGGARVRVSTSVSPGNAVREAGEDIVVGATVFHAGDVITPAVAGVLASVNARSVSVIRPVVVGVLSTGDELIDDGRPLAPGQIRESNKTMLIGLVAETGAATIDFGVVPDDEDALEATLREAADRCDAIVTSGGVSMGDYDVVKAVLSRIADMRWMEIAIKPARPFAFGQLANVDSEPIPVFGLPGNPVSSLVSYELLARPALRKMMGHRQPLAKPLRAIADSPLRRNRDGKVHYQRVHGAFADDGRYHVSAGGPQGSHQLAATAVASALAELPDGDGVAPGGDVFVYILRHSL